MFREKYVGFMFRERGFVDVTMPTLESMCLRVEGDLVCRLHVT